MATGSYFSVITLNVNGLNARTKRQRLAEWIQKQDPYICCLQEKKKDVRNQLQTIEKMVIGTYISIITLNVNVLNAPIKRHRLAEWIQTRPIYMLSIRNPLQT